MTASADNATNATEPTAAAAAQPMAGFSSEPRAAAPASDEPEDEQAAATGQPQPEPRARTKLGQDFDGTEFMRLLAMMYGIHEIPTAIKTQLDGFKLDDSKEKPTNDSGTLYATLDGVGIEVTKNSIMANGPLTPAMAYKMAAAASLNPSYQTLSLSGSLEDRTMLFLAAKHFKLRIDQSSIPQIPEDQRVSLVGKFRAFEQEAGLGTSVAEKYLTPQGQTAATPNNPRPTERPEPVRAPQPVMA